MNEKSRKPSDNTNILRTWAKHWPDSAKDAVWQRIVKRIEANDEPTTAMVVVHKSPERMQ